MSPPSTNPTTFEKKATSEPVKVNPRTKCYRCQEYEHFANQYLCQTKTLLVEAPIEEGEEEDSLEVVVHQQNDDSDASAEDRKFSGCIKT